jgi:hypothetical protein
VQRTSSLAIAMTLIELLVVICFVTPIFGAYSSASQMKLGFGGHALAIGLGLTIGLSFAWTMWTSTPKLVKLIDRLPEAYRKFCGFGVLLIFPAWIVLAGIAGAMLPTAILRLI